MIVQDDGKGRAHDVWGKAEEVALFLLEKNLIQGREGRTLWPSQLPSRWYREDGVICLSRAYKKRTKLRGQDEHKNLLQRQFQLDTRKEKVILKAAMYWSRDPKRRQNPHPWRHSKFDWLWPWATWPNIEVGPHWSSRLDQDLLRSPPIKIVLWAFRWCYELLGDSYLACHCRICST